jgi:hypothetical protein
VQMETSSKGLELSAYLRRSGNKMAAREFQ